MDLEIDVLDKELWRDDLACAVHGERVWRRY